MEHSEHELALHRAVFPGSPTVHERLVPCHTFISLPTATLKGDMGRETSRKWALTYIFQTLQQKTPYRLSCKSCLFLGKAEGPPLVVSKNL